MTEINIHLRVDLPEQFLAAFLELASKLGSVAVAPDHAVVIPPPAAAPVATVAEFSDYEACHDERRREVEQVLLPETPEEPLNNVASAARRQRVMMTWTDARCLLLIDLRRRRMAWGDILAKLNEDETLPRVASTVAIEAKYKQLRQEGLVKDTDMVGRGAKLFATARQESDIRAPVEADTPAPAPPPTVVTLQTPREQQTESTLAIELRRALEAKRSAPPARPHAPPGDRPKPLEVTIEQAISWASQRGLANGGSGIDIAKVNAKRVHLGLSEFIIKTPSRSQISA